MPEPIPSTGASVGPADCRLSMKGHNAHWIQARLAREATR